MYARSTTVQASPDRIDEGIAMVRDEVFPAVTRMPGCLGLSLLAHRESGHSVATTSWESLDAMRATAESVRPLRDRVTDVLGGGDVEVQEWEIAVVHRHRPAPAGSCTRSTWLRMAPESVGRAHDVFRFAAMPRIEELEGFCSAVLMIDRDSGLGVSTVAFTDQAAVEATREGASAIRTASMAELGADVVDVREHELVMGHLHVPEMA